MSFDFFKFTASLNHITIVWHYEDAMDSNISNPNNADNRHERRCRVLKYVKLITSHSGAVIDVTICDLSAGGARIRLPPGTIVPEVFGLAVVSERLVYPARKSWHNGQHAGVQFVGQPYHASLRHWDMQAPQHKSPPLPPPDQATRKENTMTAIEADHAVRIEPCFSLRPINSIARPDRGICNIDVLLRNRQPITAHHPFICVPLIQVKVHPAPGWTQQDILAVRKMRRFSSLRAQVLEPDSMMHCCTIALPFKSASGGAIGYGVGSEHSLMNLPDFKLTCIVGAGNYPSERLPFTVPAAALRTAIEEYFIRGIDFLQPVRC